MFITTTQAGGLGRYHSGSIFLYIYGYISDLYVFNNDKSGLPLDCARRYIEFIFAC